MPIIRKWPNIRRTYDEAIRAKLLERTWRDDPKVRVTEEDRQKAIQYWMARLIEDAVAIAKTGKPAAGWDP